MGALNMRTALTLMSGAEEKASDIGITIAVAVIDEGGNLMSFQRMDNTQLASSLLAQNKAYSAVAFQRPSKDMFDVSQPGQPGYALQDVDPRYVFAGGGMPIMIDGGIVGAVGVSGGTADQDQECAEAALASIRD